MGYVVISLVGLFVLWTLSVYYTEKKFDILHDRIKRLEERPLLIRFQIVEDQSPPVRVLPPPANPSDDPPPN